MFEKIYVLIIMTFLNISSFAYINIYPLTFNQRIDGMGAVKDYVLTNNTTKPLKYQIELENSKEKLDMTQWSEIYPKAVMLKPGEKKEIKIYIRSPRETKVGEYSTILNIKELEVPNEINRGKKVKVFTSLKVKLYGYVGKLDSSISLKELYISKGESKKDFIMMGKVKNESLRRIEIEVVLKDSSKKKEYFISEIKLKKNEEIELSNLELLLDKIEITDKEYKKIDRVCFYEKETGKLLKEESVRELRDEKGV